MKITRRFIVLSIVFCALAIEAQQHGSDKPWSDRSLADSDWSELHASMERMHVATTAVERSGNSDVNFVRLMLPHHQAAIDMARTQLLHGADPEMRRLAQEIVTDQQSEIELMQRWLKQHEAQE
jgi:uncharacterized protein (DUF305 family)